MVSIVLSWLLTRLNVIDLNLICTSLLEEVTVETRGSTRYAKNRQPFPQRLQPLLDLHI